MAGSGGWTDVTTLDRREGEQWPGQRRFRPGQAPGLIRARAIRSPRSLRSSCRRPVPGRPSRFAERLVAQVAETGGDCSARGPPMKTLLPCVRASRALLVASAVFWLAQGLALRAEGP